VPLQHQSTTPTTTSLVRGTTIEGDRHHRSLHFAYHNVVVYNITDEALNLIVEE
jgi:hypothetical protein